jgi:hypothetical protein
MRKRARQACVACNTKRVKCNVTDELPCRNCAHAGLRCEVRESRRGKHPRYNKKGAAGAGAGVGINSGGQAAVGASINANGHAGRPLASSRGETGLGHEHGRPLGFPQSQLQSQSQLNEAAASEALATLSRDRPGNQSPDGDDPKQQQHIEHKHDHSPVYPRGHRHSFSHSHAENDEEYEGSVFLGESTTLRYVPTPSQDSESSRSRLLHQIPQESLAASQNPPPSWEAERNQARLRLLTAEGVFQFPKAKVVEALLRVYFSWFHPCFAVVDEPDIWRGYKDGTLSPLLLNAILFVSAVHSDEAALEALGLGCQAQARYAFYSRAKDIYDADLEPVRLTVVQSLFLMSFWRNGPLLEKDARHWLAAALSLAQAKAMHRGRGLGAVVNPKDVKLEAIKKRTWWSLYVRERQCAAALGLPNRIRDEDCDVAQLLPRDFEHAFVGATPPRQASEYAAYQIGMASLAQLLGRIIHDGYLPGKSLNASQKVEIREDAAAWKRRLPRVMQIEGELEGPPKLHSTMLHLAYNNLLILLHRPDYVHAGSSAFNEDGSGSASASTRDRDGAIALQAAARSSRLIEDLLPGGVLRHAQVHVITNLFNTLCIHTIHLRRAEGTAVTIAEHRAKICLLGLQELQRTWEVRNWILQLFFQYLDRSTAARLLAQDDALIAATGKALGRAALSSSSGSASRRGSVAQVAQSQSLQPPQQQQQHFDNVETQKQQVLQDGSDSGSAQTNRQSFSSEAQQQQHHPAGGPSSRPWSWSTEEQNQFLFSQIENNFAFGEGGIYEWRPETAPSPRMSAYSDQQQHHHQPPPPPQQQPNIAMLYQGGVPREGSWQG